MQIIYYNMLYIMLLVFAFSLILTGLTIIISKKIGFINYPNPIVETHKDPVPYGGGIAIGITIIAALMLFNDYSSDAYKLILAIIPVIVIGIIDDSVRLSPLIKMMLEILSVIPFSIIYLNLSFFYILIFLLFIIFLQNAWNLIDVMDGLTSGVSVIIFLSFGIIVLINGGPEFYSQLSFLTAFSTLGFRQWNKYPARIFLGDTGSLLLGSLFGFMLVNFFIKDELTAGFLLMLAGIPLFEILFLIITRTRKNIPFYKGSPDHFSLRMLNGGAAVKEVNKKVLLFAVIHSMIIILLSAYGQRYVNLIIAFFINISGTVYAFNYFNRLPAKSINV